MRVTVAGGIAVLVGATSCAAAWLVDFTPSSGGAGARRPKSAGDVAMVFDPDEPRCKYHIAGQYDVRSNGYGEFGDTATTKAKMREDAAARGLDGIMSVSCAKPGTVGFERSACTGKGYTCD